MSLPSQADNRGVHHDSAPPATIAALLSLPSIESIFFRSVSLNRPAGPVKRWAVVAIVEELNAAIKRMGQKREQRLQRQQERDRRRSLKRKRREASTKSSDRKRIKSSNSPIRKEIKAEDDDDDQDTPIPDDERSDTGSDNSSESEESEDEEEAELAGLSLLNPDALKATRVTPDAVWAKLLENYDMAELDELVSRAAPV